MSDDFEVPDEFVQGPAAENAPVIPDGVGLSFEEIKAIIAKHHSLALSKDDPILLLVPILNGFLNENQKLSERHKQALGKALGEHTDKYVQGVKKSVDGLAAEISGSSVKSLQEVFQSHIETMAGFRRDVFWAAGIVAVSALVNLIAMAVRFYA